MPPYTGDPKNLDPTALADGMTGECLCGSIKVTLQKKGLFDSRNGHLCHCQNCRKWSGCVASNNIVVQKANVTIDDPGHLLKTYEDANTGSGLVTPRSFSSRCGSPVCSIPTDDETQYVLPLGIFPRIPAPEFELFVGHRHEWEAELGGTRKYRTMTAGGN